MWSLKNFKSRRILRVNRFDEFLSLLMIDYHRFPYIFFFLKLSLYKEIKFFFQPQNTKL